MSVRAIMAMSPAIDALRPLRFERAARVPALLWIPLFLAFVLPAHGQSPPGAAVKLETVSLDAALLRVHFIDIGPGLAILIETPQNRRRVFMDGGNSGLKDMETYVAHFVSASEPVDVAIVTHADADHYAGMRKIFKRYDVRAFWYTGYDSDKLGSTWRTLTKEVNAESDCSVYWPIKESVAVGDLEVLDDGGTASVTDDVLIRYLNVDDSPPAIDPISGRRFAESEQRNNASLVLKLTYGDVSFLITGDINGRRKENEELGTDGEIDSEELELWVRHTLYGPDFDLTSTVLQAPHHGSNGSCSLPFLQAVAPTWVVVTAGHKHNHPHPASLRRLATAGIATDHVLRTDEGDSTPETVLKKDPLGDDNFVFETDGSSIKRITRIRMK